MDKLVNRHGMEQCKTGPCVFRKFLYRKVVLILTVHVDDMAVASAVTKGRQLQEVLNEDFTTNDQGELSRFTGCVVTQNVEEGYLSISQTAFIETLAKCFDMSTISPNFLHRVV